MLEAEPAAGERVRDRDVGGTVVCDDCLEADAVAAVEGDGAAKECNRGRCLLVREDLGIGEAAVVVDGDVDVLPAGGVVDTACVVGVAAGVVLIAVVAPALAGTADDPAELLDVDVDELARPGAPIADRRLEPEPAQAAQPDPGQDPGDGRERHRECFCDLGGGHPQPPQLGDHRDPFEVGAVGDPPRRRGAIEQIAVALPITADPPAGTTHADTGGLGRRRQRPALINNASSELPPAAPAERRVTVQIHPSLPWG